MNPQVRALMETSGNGRVLLQGKNAGGARETGHVHTINRGKASCPASRPVLMVSLSNHEDEKRAL
ncbi:MAG: hypothetical protein KF810_00870 [Rhizobiaceae bacterium]|nr:hypothetical protein [Rhizobiaceae bacterium]